MENGLLAKRYVALALIRAKNELFDEDFVTVSELNQFVQFMQMYFVRKRLAIAITSDLERTDFQIQNGIITVTDACYVDLDRAFIYHDLEWNPVDIGSILRDMNLMIAFFIQLENGKLKTLEGYKDRSSEESEDSSYRRIVLENDLS